MKLTLPHQQEKIWLLLALLAWGLSIPLRLIFFSGYGLGDDPNFARSPLNFIDSGNLNFSDHHTNRLGMFFGQVASYLLFPVNDYTFVLPIFLSSLGVHVIALFLSRDLFHNRMAFWVSLWMLITPFETLASTSFAPDYIVSFFCILAVWGIWRGLKTANDKVLVLAGCSLGFAILTKLSAILILPSLAIAGLLTINQIKHWLWFIAGFTGMIIIGCLTFWLLQGDPLHWYTLRAIPPEGHDVTDALAFTLSIYPKYLYFKDDYQNWCQWPPELTTFGQ